MPESYKNRLSQLICITSAILFMFFFLTNNLKAGVGDLYKCEMVENLGITDENLNDIIKYNLQSFEFRRDENKLIFGVDENYFQGAEYDVEKSFEKMFLARKDQGRIAFNVQNFYYTYTSYANVILITAKCTIHKNN